MRSPLSGVLPVLSTPFDPLGALDVPSLRRLVRFQLASGAAGIAVFGMASEGFALTGAERASVLDVLAQEVGGRVPIIAGVNATSTHTAIEQAELTVAHGADVLMVLPPFMVKPTAEQSVEFFHDVADATTAEIMVQDAPNATGVPLAADVIGRICEHERITSVKVEAPPTAPKTAAVSRSVGVDVRVVGGQNAAFLLEELRCGAHATMPACEFTDLLVPAFVAATSGDDATARRAFQSLQSLIRFGTQQGIAWAVHKEVLVRRGIIESATVRLPARPLDRISTELLESILDDLAPAPYETVVGAAA